MPPKRRNTQPDTTEEGDRMTPTPKRSKSFKPSSIGKAKASVETWLNPALRMLLWGNEEEDDWRERCQVFWAGVFFVRRGLDPDDRHRLLLSILPAGASPEKLKAAAKDFESTYHELVAWFVDHVVERNKKGYVAPDLRAENAGVNWNRLSLISVFSKILWVVDTESAPDGKVGWIETLDPNENVMWAEVLGQCFLASVGDYVCASAIGPGTVGAESIGADLIRYGNTALEDGKYKWPPFREIVFDYENAEDTIPDQPSEAWDGESSCALQTPMASFKSLVTEVDHPYLEPRSFHTDREVEEILKDFETVGITQEATYVDHLLSTVSTAQQIARDEIAAGDVGPDAFPGLLDRPIMPPNLESSVLLPPPGFYQPPEYRNALSDVYARANLWGKTQLHLHVLNEERIRLDRLMYDIQNRMELIETETASVQSAWMEIETRLEKLQESFVGHNYTFDALHAAKKQLDESKARDKKMLPPRMPAEVSARNPSSVPSPFPQQLGNPYRRLSQSINAVISSKPSPYALAMASTPTRGISPANLRSQTPAPEASAPRTPAAQQYPLSVIEEMPQGTPQGTPLNWENTPVNTPPDLLGS